MIKLYATTAVQTGFNLPPYLAPEFIDPVVAKTSPKRSLSIIENVRFGLVFAKIGSIISILP
jgi:hypothetical protein